MSDVPADAPEACPGTKSESAGKGSACQGCPNQTICASGESKGPDPDIEKINANLMSVRHKLLILSGKGGVGKSTVSVTLARALASDESQHVALLDVDICGPSVPKMTGLEDEQVHQSGSGWSPVYVDDNLCIMSVGFLLSGPDDAVIWRGPRKNGLIKQFLRDVDWGESEYLLIDTPPGTGDEHLSLVTYLGTTSTSAVIVTTPQEVSLLDVRKEINFCKKVGLPILGVIENMSAFVCPKCKTESQIFMDKMGGGVEKMCLDMGVDHLGKIPLDPRVARSLDEGKNLFAVEDFQESPAVKAYQEITKRIVEKLQQPT